ncbi:uncharacterized protein [Eurosta solidaginis]|uniref:uncharacterized protein n=1 Tax=Eurosta solidaginis TaxID=178769 RepID=UPI0035307EC7
MQQKHLRVSVVLISLLSYLLLGESASVSRIAFIKDNKIKAKCTAANHEMLSKPIVLVRLAKTPLSEQNNRNQILTEDDECADANGENEEPMEQGQFSYTLVELSKSQVQNLMNRGKLKLVESEDLNEAQVNIQLNNNANAFDLYDEDDSLEEGNDEMDVAYGDLYEEDGRSRRRPWRKVQRVIRRQLTKIPRRYFRKIVRRVVG